jgi:hypothetical protein
MTTWAEAFAKYEAVKEQHAKDAHLMTPLEQQRSAEELRGIRQSLGPQIERAAVEDLRSRFEDYASSQKRLRATMAGVAKAYDPMRLQTALDLAQRAADRADVKALQRMMDEAEEPHEVRAVNEVIASIKASGDQADGAARNRLVKRAQAKLEELKYPSSVLDTLDEGSQALKGIVDTAHSLTAIALELDLPALGREIQRIHTTRDETRSVTEILPPQVYARPPETDAAKRERLFQSHPGTVAQG